MGRSSNQLGHTSQGYKTLFILKHHLSVFKVIVIQAETVNIAVADEVQGMGLSEKTQAGVASFSQNQAMKVFFLVVFLSCGSWS